MKRCIISGIVGAVAMFLLLFCIANIRACSQADEPSEYEHKDLVSKISQEECFVCGFSSDCFAGGLFLIVYVVFFVMIVFSFRCSLSNSFSVGK